MVLLVIVVPMVSCVIVGFEFVALVMPSGEICAFEIYFCCLFFGGEGEGGLQLALVGLGLCLLEGFFNTVWSF
jgi:hypothetical protein